MKLYREKCTGFSLLELAFVMLIISLLGVFSISSWQQYQQQVKLDNISRQLMTFLIRVRQAAGWSNQPYQVIDDNHLNITSLAVLNLSTSEIVARFKFVIHDNQIRLKPYDLLSPVIFYGKRTTASPGHFIVENEGIQVKVIISTRGRIRRCVVASTWQTEPLLGISPC